MMGSCTRRGTSARQSGGTDAEACAQADGRAIFEVY